MDHFFRSSQEKQQSRKDITGGRAKNPEGATGNSELESYSREKNHELIKEHSYFWN